MFTKIGVENFKLFRNPVEFELKPIMVLTGPNNCGKSTFNKLLYLISNSFKVIKPMYDHEYIDSIEFLEFDKETVAEIGELKDCISKNSNKNYFNLSLTYKNKAEIEVNSKIQYNYYGSSRNIENLTKSASLRKITFSTNGKELLDIDFDLFRGVEFDKFDETKRDFIKIENIREYLLKLRNNLNVLFKNQAKSDKNIVTILNPRWDLFLLARNNNDKFLFPSEFCKIILKFEETIDSTKCNSDTEIELVNYLLSKKITTRSHFIENYILFENELIRKITEPRMLWWYKGITYKEFRSKDELNKLFKKYPEQDLTKDEIINLIKSIDNPLAVLFIKELEFDNNNEIINFKDLRNTADKWVQKKFEKITYTNFNLLNILIWSEVSDLYHNLKNELLNTIAHNNFYSRGIQNTIHNQVNIVEEYYLIDKNSSKGSLLKNFGIFYFNNLDSDLFNSNVLSNLEFIDKWLVKLKIGKELMIESFKRNDVIFGFSYYVITMENEKVNLADLSLGIQKIVLILIKLANNSASDISSFLHKIDDDLIGDKLTEIENLKKEFEYGRIIEKNLLLFEEPESNLHPSFQSKLAEIFVDAYFYFDVHFVIETHSEYLIRKIQHIIASKQSLLTVDDIAVHYLHDPNYIPKGEKQVYKLDIREDGFMNNDFGKGFFDEASTLSLSLLNLSNFN